jgi:hypothetical protein
MEGAYLTKTYDRDPAGRMTSATGVTGRRF